MQYTSGAHICSVYQDRAQQFASVIPFIQYGLEHNEKCIYVVDDCSTDEVISEFNKRGVDLEKFLTSKQFKFVTKTGTYITNGVFDAQKTIALLLNAEAESLKEGYSGLRCTGGATWVLEDPTNTTKLIYYESQLNTIFDGHHITLLCQYNEKKFKPTTLTDILRTHPKTCIYGQDYDNQEFYTPPEYMQISDAFAATAYHEMIKEIRGS